MKLRLQRVLDTPEFTCGLLTVNNTVYTTLEDPHKTVKIKGKTRIPTGTYEIDLRRTSPMASRYREKFGDGHHGMIWLRNVPQFDYIYIHIGNRPVDTEGCILVGMTMEPQKGFIGRSTEAYVELFPLVMDAIERNERVSIDIMDCAR